MMTTEATPDARRERQRIWSSWLDEVSPALRFEYEDDRDELARLITEVVADVPSDDAGAGSDLRNDEQRRRRGWRAWLDRLPKDLDLELGDHRERLASRLAVAVSTTPQKGSWGGWLPVQLPPPIRALTDDELRARLAAVADAGRGRGRRMVLAYLARQGLDVVRDGAARCGESLFAFAALLDRAATAEPLLPELAARLGQPIEALRAFLDDGEYRPEIERALDPHVECFLRENCGGADCPPANAERKRAREKVGAWSPLVLGIDGGGRRHFLDGEPVSCGTTLELQSIEDRSDDYGEYSVPLPRGERVRYEAVLSREDAPATLHRYLGGHEFVAQLEPWMRFRWPGRSN